MKSLTDDQIKCLDLPPFISVEDAARILGVSRSTAYAGAARWLASGGREGLPVVRLGKCLRVPRPAIYQLLGAEA